jgi:cyclopropane-fatty-acyl-phospholipid synthase
LLYIGTVEHRRLHPVDHRLTYRLYVYALDIDELPVLDNRLPFFGYNRFKPASVHDADYLRAGGGSIRDKLLDLIAARFPAANITRIILVTSARYFNYAFNPVNFYFCFGAADELICAAAEVNNTFGEKHLYLLAGEPGGDTSFPARFQAPKQFHVSPFNTLDGVYHFEISDIRRELDIRIALHREGREIMYARLTGRPLPLSPGHHLRTLLTHPLLPHMTIPRIYQHAFRLRFQRHLPYHAKPVPLSPMTIRRKAPGPIERLCARLLLERLQKPRRGVLRLRLPDGREVALRGAEAGIQSAMRVNDPRFFSRVAIAGDIGFGDAFMKDEWDSDDPVAVVRFFIQNRDVFLDGEFKTNWFSRLIEIWRFAIQRNTPRGSRTNIRRHYDLSNDFFRLFLDESMAYSCAIFSGAQEPLESAQKRKYHAVTRKARLSADDHVLEIGCGWGGFAIEAVRRTGCRVTGITVSQEQCRMARERVRAAGLEDRIRIVLSDYRNHRGRYDKIVSIEMLEAVGHDYYGLFFRCLDRLLKPHGLAVVQVITIADQRYAAYRRQRDWIQKHIFPGGLLPSLTVMTRAMTRHSRLMVDHLENIGDHYAPTLAAWRQRYLARQDQVAALGFDRLFQRKWLYYLASCEAGFRERVLGDLQMVLTREANHRLAAADLGNAWPE